MYFTYVLTSGKDNKLYIGYTSNLKSRLKKHDSGKVFATKDRLPLKLIYCELCLNKYDAIKREKYFKTGFGRRFLKNRLENYNKSQARDGGQVRERQKVKVVLKGKKIIIEDWKK